MSVAEVASFQEVAFQRAERPCGLIDPERMNEFELVIENIENNEEFQQNLAAFDSLRQMSGDGKVMFGKKIINLTAQWEHGNYIRSILIPESRKGGDQLFRTLNVITHQNGMVYGERHYYEVTSQKLFREPQIGSCGIFPFDRHDLDRFSQISKNARELTTRRIARIALIG
jgi:hypothetical protein